MSAVLAHEQIDSVIADLELLKDIRRASEDVNNCELDGTERLTLRVGAHNGIEDQPIAFVHGGGFYLVLTALKAMEREVLSRLQTKAIEVEA